MELMIRGRKKYFRIADSYLYSQKVNRDCGGKCKDLQGLCAEAPVQIDTLFLIPVCCCPQLLGPAFAYPVNITIQEVHINPFLASAKLCVRGNCNITV